MIVQCCTLYICKKIAVLQTIKVLGEYSVAHLTSVKGVQCCTQLQRQGSAVLHTMQM